MPVYNRSRAAQHFNYCGNYASGIFMRKETQPLKIVFVGQADHGKSVLIERIVLETASSTEKKTQPNTSDRTEIPFQSARRQYVIIDVPEQKEFLENMVAGTLDADAAILVIAANEDVGKESRRHAYLLRLLGIRQLVVVVNKMEAARYEAKRFREIESEYGAFLTNLGLEARHFIPASAIGGENVARRSETKMDWYGGPTVLEALDDLEPQKALRELPLRFCVQDVSRVDDRRIIVGRVETGVLRVGENIVFSPANKTTGVATIERGKGTSIETASAGDSIAITLREQIFVERGYVASHENETPIETNRFHADVFWIARAPLRLDTTYTIRVATQEVKCRVVSIDQITDSSALKETTEPRTEIARNESGRLTIETRAVLVLDNHDRIPNLGRFVIIDDGEISGAGIVFGGAYTDRRTAKSKNIFWTEGKITAAQRASNNGHRGAVIWLTGLSGAGKSTIAQALEAELFKRAMHTYVLDGDNIRHGLNSNLGFSPEDRVENIRRVSEVAKLMADAGAVVITAFISPYRRERRRAREIALEGNTQFIEVFVDAPIEVCEERDPKKLYAKARAGKIRDFTGIDAPYEAPEDAEIVVRTHKQTLDESLATVLDQLLPRLRPEETAS